MFRPAAAFVILILSGFCAPGSGAAVYSSDGSAASVQALQDAGHDGDTITLPAGTFSWTSSPKITNAITLQGATTVAGTGGMNYTVKDVTIIMDDVLRNNTFLYIPI